MEQEKQGEKDLSLLGLKRSRAQSTVVSGRVTHPSKRLKANNPRSTKVMNNSDDLSESPATSEVADDDSSHSETSHELDASIDSDEADKQAQNPLRETEDRKYEGPQNDASIMVKGHEVPDVGEDALAEGDEPMRESTATHSKQVVAEIDTHVSPASRRSPRPPVRELPEMSSLEDRDLFSPPNPPKAQQRQIRIDEEQSTKSPNRPPARHPPRKEVTATQSNENDVPDQENLDLSRSGPEANNGSHTRPVRSSSFAQAMKGAISTKIDPPEGTAVGPGESPEARRLQSLHRFLVKRASRGSIDQGKFDLAPGHSAFQSTKPEMSEQEESNSTTNDPTTIQEEEATSEPQTARSPASRAYKDHPGSVLMPLPRPLGSSCDQQLALESVVSNQHPPLDADASTPNNIQSESFATGQNLSALQSDKDEETEATLAIKPASSLSYTLSQPPPTVQSSTTSTCEPQIRAPSAESPTVPNTSPKGATLHPVTVPIADIDPPLPFTNKDRPWEGSGIPNINPMDITENTESDGRPERPTSISTTSEAGDQVLDGEVRAPEVSSLTERAGNHSREALTGEEIMEEIRRQDWLRDRIVQTLSLRLKDLELSEATLKAAKLKARQLHIISETSEEYNDKVRKLQEWGWEIETYHITLDALGLADQSIRRQILAKKDGLEDKCRQLETAMGDSGQSTAKAELDRAETQHQKAQKCLRDVCQPLIGLKGSYALWSAPGSRIYDLMKTCQEVLGDAGERH